MVRLVLVVTILNAVCLRPTFAQVGPNRAAAGSAERSSISHTLEAAPIPPTHRSARAKLLLKGGPPLTTFEAVSLILERGHEVIVTDSQGRRTRGLISSVSSAGLVLFRKRGVLSRAVEESYRAESIETVRVVDSRWNGLLLGLAVTASSLVGVRACTGECQGTAAIAGVVGGVAPVLGWGIDGEVNAAVYERGGRTSPVSFAPLSQRRAIGAMVRVGF